MEPSVTDVPMYPKSGTTVSALSASSKGESSTPSSLAGDQGLRTSAIPLPEGNIGNVRNSRTDVDARIHKPRDSKSEDVDGSHATAGLRVDDKQPPNPDLVLLFNTPSADASQEEWTAAQAELARLVKNLHGAGLLTSLASGPDGAQQRILFIKAVQSAVRAEAQKER